MTPKSRATLKQYFLEGKLPSQSHFEELIEATLNKRDDQFHGLWKKHVTYRAGDVVIHDQAFWELTDDGLGCRRELCSDQPPAPNNADWRLFVLPVTDEDWQLDDVPLAAEASEEATAATPMTMHANPRVIAVGIGTEEPAAILDVVEPERGRLMLNGCARGGAMLRLIGLGPEHAGHYVAVCVAEQAALVSDAPEGFAFHGGATEETFCAQPQGETTPPLMAVKRDGRVGIGTDTPDARLEVTNGASGRFLFNLDRKPNPALGIINQRPGCRENYVAWGVDNDVAALVTDSDHGFVFRAGGPCGSDDHEIDVNQGRPLVRILRDGKLGIGRRPDAYQLDVAGITRAYGVYIDTNQNNMTSVEPLCRVTEQLMALEPVTFEWSEGLAPDDPGRHIGLHAHKVQEHFPEAVKTGAEFTSKAVAYDALVPVLIKALQEQQTEMEALQTRLAELEQRLATLESPQAPAR